MDWKHLLAYITGTVAQELLLRNEYRVAYLGAADNVSGPLASCLSSINQPVLRTRNALSTLLPSLLADI